jgi:hypothetical protein
MASAILTFTDLGGSTMRRVGGSKVAGQASKMPASLSVVIARPQLAGGR